MQQQAHNSIPRRPKEQGEETRRMILSAIQSCSGLRYSELARMTGLANGTLSHHIKILQIQKQIEVKRYRSSTWLIPENYEESLCNAISAASHATTVEIVKSLLIHEHDFRQLHDTMAKSRSTVFHHLSRLRSGGVVSRRMINRIWIYGIQDADKAVLLINRSKKVAECHQTNLWSYPQ